MRELYHLENARSDDQREHMRQLQAADVCVFCTAHEQELIYELPHWRVFRNLYPYRCALHLLIAPRWHFTSLVELRPMMLAEQHRAIEWAIKEFDLTHFALTTRSGDMHMTGGSIAHVHTHLTVADPDATEPLRVRLSPRGKEHQS